MLIQVSEFACLLFDLFTMWLFVLKFWDWFGVRLVYMFSFLLLNNVLLAALRTLL